MMTLQNSNLILNKTLYLKNHFRCVRCYISHFLIAETKTHHPQSKVGEVYLTHASVYHQLALREKHGERQRKLLSRRQPGSKTCYKITPLPATHPRIYFFQSGPASGRHTQLWTHSMHVLPSGHNLLAKSPGHVIFVGETSDLN